MADPTDDLVDDETRRAAAEEAAVHGRADRPPTEHEARLAGEHGEPDERTAAAYEEAMERRAEAEGEGRVD
jgi:hypothetical protein